MCDSLPESPGRALILGLGNDDRGDDAAGLLAVRELRALGVDAHEFLADGATLLLRWEKTDHVVLIDAVTTGRLPGTVSVWHGPPRNLRLPRSASSHGFGLAEALELASALDRLPQSLTIYGIEATNFAPGQAASHEVLAAARQVACTISATVRAASLIF